MARNKTYNIYTTNHCFRLELSKTEDQDYVLFVFKLKNVDGTNVGVVELKIDRNLLKNEDFKEILKHCMGKVR